MNETEEKSREKNFFSNGYIKSQLKLMDLQNQLCKLI